MRVTRVTRLFGAAAIGLLAGCGGAAAPASSGPPNTPSQSARAATSTSAQAKPAAAQSSAAASSAALTASGAASASAAPAASGGAVSVRLAVSQNVTGNAPVWLTQQAGLFQKNGLKLELENISATTAIKQLVAGQIDGLVAGAPESISAHAAGAAIQMVAVFQTSCNMLLVAPKDVSAVTQLKGKKVAVITKASVNGVCTVADLKNHGLQPNSDYQIVETGSNGTYAAMVAALQARNVDAGALQPDFARKLAAGGQFHTLYDMATAQGAPLTAASSLTFGTSFIQAHPTEVQKTLDSLLQGEAYFKQHKDEAQNILKTIFKVTDPTELEDAYNRQVELMAKNVVPRPELFPDLITALGQVEPAVKTMDLNSLLAPRFAQDATQRGLTNF